MSKIVITSYKNCIGVFVFKKQKPEIIRLFPKTEFKLGSIYLGRISKIVPEMNACFASVQKGTECFVPLYKCMHEGEYIILQIDQYGRGEKKMKAKHRIDLPGQYCVLDEDIKGIKYSKHISRMNIKKINAYLSNENIDIQNISPGYIIRTASEVLDDFSPLLKEILYFKQSYRDIKTKAAHAAYGTLLYEPGSEYSIFLQTLYKSDDDEIITDDLVYYNELKTQFPNYNIRLYDDDYSLTKLYSLNTHIEEALSQKVYLPSGGNIILQITEALLAVDINSGKGTSQKNKNSDELYFLTNKEATLEILRQLKLRNISGMILIDYINMRDKNLYTQLEDIIKKDLPNDYSKVQFIDWTGLGLGEFTRKKNGLSIYEALDMNVIG